MNTCLSPNLLKILLVEDSEHNLPAFIRAFSINGYEVEISQSASAEEAQELLSCEFIKFDALVTNYKLPGMNGLELFTKLRNTNNNLPVILLVAFGSEEFAVEALKAGVNDYIIKDRDQKYLKLLPFVVSSVIKDLTDKQSRINIESAIRDSEKKLSDILNFLPDITYAVDNQGKIILWNHAAENFTGIKASEILGKQYSDYLTALYGEGPPPLMEMALAPSPEKEKQFPAIKKERDFVFCENLTLGGKNDNVYVSAKAAPLYGPNGKITGAIESIRNITDQKNTLDALRLMQYSVDQASEMIMWGNSEGQFTYVNKKTCDTLGYTKEELLNKVIWDVDEEYSYEYFKKYWIKMGQIDQDRFETVYWRKDGSRFPVDISVSQGVFEGNKLNFSFARDISERKQMEEDLQKANEELEVRVNERTEELAMTINMLQEAVTMLQKEISERIKSEEALMQSQEALSNSSKEMYDLYNHAPCGYHSLDANGSIVRINDTELNWLGYSRDEIVGVKKFTDLITQEGIGIFNETFPKLKIEGSVNDIEQVFVRKDGTLLPVVLNATAIYDNNGKYLMSRSTVFDMTELKQTEEKLRQKDRMMMQQSRQAAMGEMIGNIAHQWRQPLNTLGLLIQQLPCFYDTPDFTREFINSNTDESMKLIEHMSQTIDDFRNFFRPDREKTSFDIKKLILKTISLIEASFISQNISITKKLEDELFVSGYPNEFSQVLLTILNNAREAFAGRKTKKAGVTIKSFREGDRVVVTVSDNAGGILEQNIDKIFEPYFTTKGSGGGTGIGLYMSKTIIQNNMNGSLTARNTDKGAEFRIEI